MFITCFGQYGHHQMLKYIVGKLLLFLLCCYRMCGPADFVACFVLEHAMKKKKRKHDTPSITHMRI
jgi:hypothetical protein